MSRVMLAAGYLGPDAQVTALDAASLVQFTLSPDRLEDTALLESPFASPGRYVAEILRRLRRLSPGAWLYLALNPFLRVGPLVVDEILARAAALRPEDLAFAVFTDGADRPLGYLLRAWELDRCPPAHLGLLSACDGALDERLLRASLGPGRRLPLGRSLGAGEVSEGANGFWPLSPALRRAAARAAETLEALPSDEARAQALVCTERAAVIGYHAGDVLFWAQALRLEPGAFRTLVVLEPYADIPAYLAPELRCLSLRYPVPHRPGFEVYDDLALLSECVDQLQREPGVGDCFWHLFRPFRDYNRARHHLRESMAFAIGGAGHPIRPPVALSALSQRERGMTTPQPRRIVVHFEGGWSLKEFPRERRGELLQLLCDAGYAPIVLGKPEPSCPEVPAVPYTDLASFRVLLGSAEALVGCDSFPAHFAQVLGVPTVQLFGSTRPHNSRGIESPRYRLLHHPMPCVPCGQVTACRLDGGHSCYAQASPQEVLAALRDLSPLGPAPPPRPLAEVQRLADELAPVVAFPSRASLGEVAMDRFLDSLFSQVSLERVTACPLCGSADLRPVGRRFRLPVSACAGCGLWLVQERIAPRDLGVLYSERYWTDFMLLHGYPTHMERYLFDYVAALERVAHIGALVRPGAAVLDIGCALGALPRRLRESGYRAAGLELDRQLARRASLCSGVPIYPGLEELARGEPPLDAVVMFDVFEHLYDPIGYLRGLRPLLAPDAILLLETFRTDSPAFQREGLGHEDVRPIEHPFMYRLAHIEDLLRRAGLEPLQVTYPLGEDHARVRVAARWSREPDAPG